jgi:antitoxin (DNA-binding transcriptional repressor) of toxin-antitoxin stability system
MARKKPAKPPIRRTVSATAAAKTFGGLIDRVREERAEYMVERGGTPVARIVPIGATSCTLAELADLLERRTDLDPAYLDEVEAGVKAWNRPAVPGDPWTSS